MSYDFLFRFEIGRRVILAVGSNPTLSAIRSVATDCASLFVFMGYSGTLVFLDVAWLTVLHGQKVGNPLEIRPFSVADLEFEPSGVTAGLQRHSFRIWRGACRFQDWIVINTLIIEL